MLQSCRAVLSAALVLCMTLGIAPAKALAQNARQWADARKVMVDADLVPNGIKNPAVLASMRGTPRHEFVPVALRRQAYFDMSLPIGHHQTISPPFIVASMTQQLDPRPTDKVLEVGTGSGYQAAVLSGLVREVYTIEIIEEMGKAAAERLQRLGYVNVKPRIGDGYQGWPEQAPFDKIIVTCSPEQIPRPLVDQLREGGRMLIPLGENYQQTLYMLTKENGKMVSQALEPTFFVPMTGKADTLRTPDDGTPLSPLVNNGFERHELFPNQPDGWFYLRHARLDMTTLAGHGKQCLTFSNDEPGRGSQALQGMAVDGRVVHSLDLSAWVRCDNVHFGQTPDQLPRVLVTFFDEQRGAIAQQALGPWEGTFSWSKKRANVLVPLEARVAIIAIGLLGGVGEVSLDDIEILPAPDVASRLSPDAPASSAPRTPSPSRR